jgi:hypothetical protein
MLRERWKELLIACGTVLVLSGWLAALDETKRILVEPPFLATAGKIALGRKLVERFAYAIYYRV